MAPQEMIMMAESLSLQAMAAWGQTKQSLGEIGKEPIETDPVTGQTVVKGEQTDGFIRGMSNVWIYILSAVACVAGIVSFIAVTGNLVDVASFLLAIVIAPTVVYQKRELQVLGSLRDQQNRLRQSANTLAAENDKFAASLTQLGAQVDSLQQVESELSDIAESTGKDVHHLVELVQQNGELLDKIQTELNVQIMQQIITAVLQTDRDRNFSLSPQEVQVLEMRLENIPAVNFDAKHFEDFLHRSNQKTDLNITDICNIARHLNDSTIPEEDRIFSLNPKDILAQ